MCGYGRSFFEFPLFAHRMLAERLRPRRSLVQPECEVDIQLLGVEEAVSSVLLPGAAHGRCRHMPFWRSPGRVARWEGKVAGQL